MSVGVSVVDVLARSAGRPERVALVGDGRAWSYAELDAAVDARADAIRGAGAAEGVAAVAAEPDATTVIELLALWRLGVVPAPLNTRLTPAERSAARATLAGVALPPTTQVVLWTSGTSGRPRGVALSFENLAAVTAGSAERLGLGADDVWLASLSPGHVGGLVLIVRSILLGGPLVAPGALGAEAMAELLRGTRPNDAGMSASAAPGPTPSHLSLVPTQLHRLLDGWAGVAPPAAVRCVLVGGAHAPTTLVERAVAAGWPIALTYGATEMSSQIATAPPALVRELRGSVGPAMPGVELRIAASGEIECRGPTLALGYVGGAPTAAGNTGGREPKGGAAARVSPADRDGWYRTGDVGRLDEAGRLWVTGRRIDRIVSGGVTIDAMEVEEALRAHPSVVDACVVGVPDPEWGERVAACVVPVEGEFDAAEVTAHLRGLLMAAKVPRAWRLAEALRLNANGKVDRAAVRASLSGA